MTETEIRTKSSQNDTFSCFIRSIFQTLKNYWIKHHAGENQTPSVPLLLACGTISSSCGQLSSYPLALVRTKMQAQGRYYQCS